MKLWLLRHARVLLPEGLCYGASDVPADAALTRQAAQAFAPLPPPGTPVWVSGLLRAQQMAGALQAERPDLGAARMDTRLNEMDFGAWELQRWDTMPRNAFDDWMADFAHHRFGGAESTQMLLHRVAAALGDLRPATSTDVVWVTHAGVIRAVQHIVTSGGVHIRDAAEWPKDAPEPGGWTSLSF
ncbi:histidine phosphatase family protein [Hydrogenophaga sp. PBL-H3]|uniref:histidine phosphatase family protein n=1 Tax=Hydrogenophaga sp. PBL-H3 TaxID=434010 RepID=UPI001320239F|nr:histidine phosphatase family protein [Hydrogenophaga sp. PBL-H3]QHE76280.1 phosphoglycerate kinase [Hydrogenophaga sp. PBL-H3]QHE80704.1 phosphoglycerate kinase [Hydrogenophaga sp. PBL-H3]